MKRGFIAYEAKNNSRPDIDYCPNFGFEHGLDG